MWPITQTIRDKINVVFDFLRRSLHKTKENEWRIERIWKDMIIESYHKNRRLKWYGNVERYEWDGSRSDSQEEEDSSKMGRKRMLWKGDWEDGRLWKLKTTNSWRKKSKRRRRRNVMLYAHCKPTAFLHSVAQMVISRLIDYQ